MKFEIRKAKLVKGEIIMSDEVLYEDDNAKEIIDTLEKLHEEKLPQGEFYVATGTEEAMDEMEKKLKEEEKEKWLYQSKN
jgi:hypothetical protein